MRAVLRPCLILVAALLTAGAAVAGSTDRPDNIADAMLPDGCDGSQAITAGVLEARLAAEEGPRISRDIGGVALVDQPASQVDALWLLVGETLRAPGALASRHRGAAACQTARCVAQAVFGRETGARLLYLLARHGYNASHLTGLGSAAWRADELDRAIAALEDLPPALSRREPGRVRLLTLDLHPGGLERFIPGPAHSSRVGGHVIAISGPDLLGVRVSTAWQQRAPSQQRAVLLHEVAHDIMRQRAASGLLVGWAAAASGDRARTAVSRYAATDLMEDFAESVTAYRYSPARLKAASPARYAFLRKELFERREYPVSKRCAA